MVGKLFASSSRLPEIARAGALHHLEKLIFSKWAGLPTNEWSSAHNEHFALAAMHLIQKAEREEIEIVEVLKKNARDILEVKLPPLRNRLTPEMCVMINSLIAY